MDDSLHTPENLQPLQSPQPYYYPEDRIGQSDAILPATNTINQVAPHPYQFSQAGQIPQQNQQTISYPELQPSPILSHRLKENRSFLVFFLLSIITLGFWATGTIARIGRDLNITSTKWDGKRTINFWLVSFLIAPLTLGIFWIIWEHTTCNRMAKALKQRGQEVCISAIDFWILCILLGFTVITPIYYRYLWLKAINTINQDYNNRGF